MPIPQRSRFTYGGSGDFTTGLSVRPWIPVDETVGGMRKAASGIPASYIVRRDVLLELGLRIEESQWDELLAFVAFGQTAQSFRWFPDATLTDPDYDNFEVYLDAPAAGERWAPTRDGSYPRMLEMKITLRGVGGALPFMPFFADA